MSLKLIEEEIKNNQIDIQQVQQPVQVVILSPEIKKPESHKKYFDKIKISQINSEKKIKKRLENQNKSINKITYHRYQQDQKSFHSSLNKKRYKSMDKNNPNSQNLDQKSLRNKSVFAKTSYQFITKKDIGYSANHILVDSDHIKQNQRFNNIILQYQDDIIVYYQFQSEKDDEIQESFISYSQYSSKVIQNKKESRVKLSDPEKLPSGQLYQDLDTDKSIALPNQQVRITSFDDFNLYQNDSQQNNNVLKVENFMQQTLRPYSPPYGKKFQESYSFSVKKLIQNEFLESDQLKFDAQLDCYYNPLTNNYYKKI